MRSGSGSDVFADCRPECYWLEDAPLRSFDAGPLPEKVDLLVIGGGYTGLAAAIEAAKGGMSVLVVDREAIGAGCSSRNGGQVSTSIKPSLAALTKAHGAEVAARIRAEGRNALAHVADVVEELGIDCDWTRTGRYMAAHTPRQFEALQRMAETAERQGDPPLTVVPRAEQHAELGSERYHGGVVTPLYGAVQPARLHAGLADAAQAAGVTLAGKAEVRQLQREGSGFKALTARGKVAVRHVALATNGYSGPLSPWHRRRVLPIGSYILATEPLAEDVALGLIPKKRMVVDTRKVVIYFRLSPDGRRVVFGGRAALAETDPMRALPRLYDMMLDIFPQLAGTRVTHCWHGFVAYTFDTLPHIGTHEGVHYAMGYCGSGVSLSLYFGKRLGQKVLGRPEGATALDGIPFQTRPFYWGKPWFLAPSVFYYRMMDRLM